MIIWQKNYSLLPGKIKQLREKSEMTQAELARELGLTRSSINAWEMGLSVPSTPFIVELAKLFGVSTDYLLGLDTTATLKVDGLSEREVSILTELVACFRGKSEK
mgnify:CR=1 FL=1